MMIETEVQAILDTNNFATSSIDTKPDVDSKLYPTFKWNYENTSAFLDEYEKRLEHFRDPKVKKKNLWQAISDAMAEKGFVIAAEGLDKKMRNMKVTYFKILDSIHTRSSRRINWEYFHRFEQIFADDKNIKRTHMIATIVPVLTAAAAAAQRDAVKVEKIVGDVEHNDDNADGVGVVEEEDEEDEEDVDMMVHHHHEQQHMEVAQQEFVGDEQVLQVQECSMKDEVEYVEHAMLHNYTINIKDAEYIAASPAPSQAGSTASSRIRMRMYRKRQLDLDTEKVQELKRIREQLEEQNVIQKEQTRLFRRICEVLEKRK